MCYGYHRVKDEDTGKLHWVANKDLIQLERQGKVKEREDGWVFARDMAGVLIHEAARAMRFDLVPRWYEPKLPLPEALKRKQSRAKAAPGFDSYNAKSETVAELPSFRAPWAEGKRCLVTLSEFRERPNMKVAPPEYRGREYLVHLDEPRWAAGLYDVRDAGEDRLESFALLTVPSDGNRVLQGIYHLRCPVLLDALGAEEWLDPRTTPARAREMCRLLPAEHMAAELARPKST